MTGIKVQPDTEWGLGTVAVRFTVEQGVHPALIPVLAYPYIKKAIEQFERLGDGKGHKYRFRDDIPIRFQYSRLQADPYDLHTRGIADYGDRLFGQGLIDCVALVTFEQPKVHINPEVLEHPGPEHGFLPYEELPAELRQALEAGETPIDIQEEKTEDG